jgi:hypothetical protein
VHTASQLDLTMFGLEIDGRPVTIDELVPDWHDHDRFGLIVHDPLGGVGASLLTQAVIAKYFDHRRATGRDRQPAYPEIYAFHVGGRHGDHTIYDFWPANKEVFVAADPSLVLEAINERGITRLAVPDGTAQAIELWWPHHQSARDRIQTAWTYAPAGRVRGGDLTIRALSAATEENPAWLLDPLPAIQSAARSENEDDRLWAQAAGQRLDEIHPDDRRRAVELRAHVVDSGLAVESYRRIGLEDALGRLSPRP